jgi:hypothetical protein
MYRVTTLLDTRELKERGVKADGKRMREKKVKEIEKRRFVTNLVLNFSQAFLLCI